MVKSFFVAGTDTGVGKTLTTALLVRCLRQHGVDAAFMKPLASGCFRLGGDLVSEDVEFLRQATGLDDPLDLINPIRLEEPLAPLMAARRAGLDTSTWLPQIRDAFWELQSRHECVVVEGVGGLLVPVAEQGHSIFSNVDIMEQLELSAVLVCRRTLGTINHSLLSCRVPLQRPCNLQGLIFCDASPVAAHDVAAEHSPEMVAEISGLPVWCQLPHRADLDPMDLAMLDEVMVSSWPYLTA